MVQLQPDFEKPQVEVKLEIFSEQARNWGVEMLLGKQVL